MFPPHRLKLRQEFRRTFRIKLQQKEQTGMWENNYKSTTEILFIFLYAHMGKTSLEKL